MRRPLFLLLSLITLAAFTPVSRQVKSIVKADLDFLVKFYKELHANPEISLEEKNTSAKLATELRELGFEVTENFGGYGVVGVLKNGEGPQIMYRTDMDALPMSEKTGLDYASTKKVMYGGEQVGAMHSCGHDVHMTTWLGTARAMVEMKDQWSGTLVLIGQPAEEIGAGAKMMLEEGLYEKYGVPDLGIGLHSFPTIEAGKVGVAEGYTLANTEMIDIKVYGVGAHGAAPHMSIDPIVTASMMIMELQTIVARSLNPIDNGVVTVGAIKGGTKHNIIPDEVTLQLTVRTYTEEVRQLIHKRIREIAKGTAIAAGVPEDKMPEVIIPDEFTPSNYNDPDLVAKFKGFASEAIGSENVAYEAPQMFGEDFARYGRTKEDVPTMMFFLGTVTRDKIEKGNLPGLHSPFFAPTPEKTIETGVTVMTSSLIGFFNE